MYADKHKYKQNQNKWMNETGKILEEVVISLSEDEKWRQEFFFWQREKKVCNLKKGLFSEGLGADGEGRPKERTSNPPQKQDLVTQPPIRIFSQKFHSIHWRQKLFLALSLGLVWFYLDLSKISYFYCYLSVLNKT